MTWKNEIVKKKHKYGTDKPTKRRMDRQKKRNVESRATTKKFRLADELTNHLDMA